VIDVFERQLGGLREQEIGYNQLQSVVYNIDDPDLVSDLSDTDTDSIVLNNTGGRLNDRVKGHTLGPKRK